MDNDYVIFFVAALFVVIGAGLFRVGLMNHATTKPRHHGCWLTIIRIRRETPAPPRTISTDFFPS